MHPRPWRRKPTHLACLQGFWEASGFFFYHRGWRNFEPLRPPSRPGASWSARRRALADCRKSGVKGFSGPFQEPSSLFQSIFCMPLFKTVLWVCHTSPSQAFQRWVRSGCVLQLSAPSRPGQNCLKMAVF